MVINLKSPGLKRCFVILLFLFLASHPSLSAAEPPPQETKEALRSQALESLKAGHLNQAAGFIDKIKKLYPKDPLGYWLATQVYWRLKQLPAIIFEVRRAEIAYGVRSLDLYFEQARALYLLDGYGATLQVFDRAQALMDEMLKAQ